MVQTTELIAVKKIINPHNADKSIKAEPEGHPNHAITVEPGSWRQIQSQQEAPWTLGPAEIQITLYSLNTTAKQNVYLELCYSVDGRRSFLYRLNSDTIWKQAPWQDDQLNYHLHVSLPDDSVGILVIGTLDEGED